MGRFDHPRGNLLQLIGGVTLRYQGQSLRIQRASGMPVLWPVLFLFPKKTKVRIEPALSSAALIILIQEKNASFMLYTRPGSGHNEVI
ncbi:hypothetical protein CHH60_14345 [Paenibacillus sp. 7523-1]|nr:hypothetical protein CHH60_14345 [Paenibacillus sp. 7523-1]